MILASSLIVLIFVSLVALQVSVDKVPERRESNVFEEYARAARASFYYDTESALLRLSSFSKFAGERGAFAVYATSRYSGQKVDITLSNFLGNTLENVTVYQTLSREYGFSQSVKDRDSFTASFPTSSVGPYNVTVEYFHGGRKNVFSLNSMASAGTVSFVAVVTQNSVSKEVMARNY